MYVKLLVVISIVRKVDSPKSWVQKFKILTETSLNRQDIGKPPSPPPSDPSMVWLFEQLQKKTDQTFADNRAASGLAATPPPAPAFESLRSLLEGERNTPRASGMLQQPSRIPELERLLVNPGQWTQQNPTQAPPSPSAAAAAPIRTDSASSSIASAAAPNSTNAEDGLAKLLRALQKQYFPEKND